MVLKAFSFKTYRELLTVPREFYFFSLFLNTLSCYKKYLYDYLFYTNENSLKNSIETSLILRALPMQDSITESKTINYILFMVFC